MTEAWIGTRSGARFFPWSPRAEDVRIEDIAFALAGIYRWGGHTRMTVAQHCHQVSLLVPRELALQALMHDASEAYLGDVLRPIKRLQPDYREREDAVMGVLGEVFGFGWPMHDEVREADDLAMAIEARELMGLDPVADCGLSVAVDEESWRYRAEPLWLPREAERMFLARFNVLTGRVSAAGRVLPFVRGRR